jgi:hypothetical protein
MACRFYTLCNFVTLGVTCVCVCVSLSLSLLLNRYSFGLFLLDSCFVTDHCVYGDSCLHLMWVMDRKE